MVAVLAAHLGLRAVLAVAARRPSSVVPAAALAALVSVPAAALAFTGLYAVGGTAVQMLKQCDGNFSRENIMKQAANLQNLALPTLLPGITVSTSPTNFHPIRQLQLQRWTGARWERFGEVIEGAGA